MATLPTPATTSPDNQSPHRGIVLPALTGGIAITVGLWCLWWLLHTPALSTPPALAGPLLIGAMVALAAFVSRWTGQNRLRFGLTAGLVSGALNLMLLGSMITQPAAAPAAAAATDPAAVAPGVSAVQPNTLLVMLGFVVLSAAFGAIGAAVSRAIPPARQLITARDWLGRMGWLTALSVLPLLLLGGLVTSANAGLSVPDWPGTFGSNMFLYPVALMDSADPRIFKEHTHRLFGALVGAVTFLQMIMILVHDPRRTLKIAAVVSFVLVVIQGVLGGTWVVEKIPFMPVIHGVLGQVFFAGMVALALALSASFISTPLAVVTGKARTLMPLMLGGLVVQLAFGATYRHLRGQSGASHALMSHIAFSIVVMIIVIIAGIVAIKAARAWAAATPSFGPLAARLRTLGVSLHGVVALQFLLGWVAWGVIAMSKDGGTRVSPTADQLASTPQVPVLEITIRTLHQANGALLLSLAAVVALWTFRLTRSTEAAADPVLAAQANV